MMEKLPRERKQEQHQAHPKNGNFEDTYLLRVIKRRGKANLRCTQPTSVLIN